MLLITEYVSHQDLDVICEEKEDKTKSYRIKGAFLQSEVKNRNGRIYGKPLIEREIKSFNKEKISQRRSFGELDHPPTPTINLDRVSHMIESLQMENNDALGVAKILDTPKGKIVSTMLSEGAKLGVSSRGVGSLNGDKVNNDFKLITVDIVADPSAPEAFVDGVLEGKEWIIDGNKVVAKAVEQLEENLAKKGSKEILRDIQEFLRSIKF